jgi:transcription elongation factor GreA-like protein
MKIDEDDSIGELEHRERERLTRQLRTIELIPSIPRRLGADATPKELSDDKRAARRVAFALEQVLRAWGGPTRRPSKEELMPEAAQLDWKRWWRYEKMCIKHQMRYIATWQSKQDDKKTKLWATSAMNKLLNEMRWVEYALRLDT